MVEFEARLRGAAIEDHVNGASEVFLDMARAGGADAARNVGAGRGDGNAGGGEKLARGRVRGDADRERIEAGGDKLANAAGRAGPLRQDKRQRPRPKLFRQGQRLAVELNEIARGVEAFHMRDQRIEARPALRLENARDRRSVGGIGAQAVHRLGRKRDEAAGAQNTRGLRYCSVIRLNDHPETICCCWRGWAEPSFPRRRESISAKNVCLCMWLPWVPAFAGTTLRPAHLNAASG